MLPLAFVYLEISNVVPSTLTSIKSSYDAFEVTDNAFSSFSVTVWLSPLIILGANFGITVEPVISFVPSKSLKFFLHLLQFQYSILPNSSVVASFFATCVNSWPKAAISSVLVVLHVVQVNVLIPLFTQVGSVVTAPESHVWSVLAIGLSPVLASHLVQWCDSLPSLVQVGSISIVHLVL